MLVVPAMLALFVTRIVFRCIVAHDMHRVEDIPGKSP